MVIPFTRSNWRRNSPQSAQNYRSIPVTTGGETPPSQPPKPKTVVSIPVKFIQPENSSKAAKPRSDSAVLIQKLWRGFRVRKSVKKILDIQRQVEEAEKIIQDGTTVEAIRRDERERLKLSERLMDLLFRLDSVIGFDVAVKDLRKSVIRRAILLQEKLDSIGAVDRAIDEVSDVKLCENVEEQDPQGSEESELSGPVERELGVVKEEKSSNGVTLEKMMEENNRLMKLVSDVCEKSEKQTQILNSLCKRVGQLENAIACDKICRKNKKQRRIVIPDPVSTRNKDSHRAKLTFEFVS